MVEMVETEVTGDEADDRVVVPSPLSPWRRGNLARTAKILPVAVRMYTPLGVLMMKICCPDGILFGSDFAPDCVLVAVPGNIISEM